MLASVARRRSLVVVPQTCLCRRRLHRRMEYRLLSSKKNVPISVEEAIVDPSLSARLTQFGIQDVSSLHSDIVTNLESIYGKHNVTESTLDSFGQSSLEALAQSIQKEQQQSSNKNNTNPRKRRPSRSITISIPHHHDKSDQQQQQQQQHTITWRQGESLMELARQDTILKDYIEASCNGTMACCSCHVYLDTASYQASTTNNTTICEMEMDMLMNLAHEYREGSSRLSCQVQLNPELLKLDEVVVTIPSGVNNVWNDK